MGNPKLVALLFLVLPSITFSQDTFMGLVIEDEESPSTYARNLYGSGWIDADSDGEDTREEVLIDEALATDLWWGPYTGKIFTDAGDLDIDHMVPLREAHVSGGHAWTRAKRIAYANDLDNAQHLIAVHNSANRSKGAKDPAEWMPPNRSYWCQYLADWIEIKQNFELSIDQDEADALELGLAVCQLYRIRDALAGRH